MRGRASCQYRLIRAKVIYLGDLNDRVAPLKGYSEVRRGEVAAQSNGDKFLGS
jgi:hypothetical protein